MKWIKRYEKFVIVRDNFKHTKILTLDTCQPSLIQHDSVQLAQNFRKDGKTKIQMFSVFKHKLSTIGQTFCASSRIQRSWIIVWFFYFVQPSKFLVASRSGSSDFVRFLSFKFRTSTRLGKINQTKIQDGGDDSVFLCFVFIEPVASINLMKSSMLAKAQLPKSWLDISFTCKRQTEAIRTQTWL